MKKISKIFLISAMAVLLLTGCYKQDTTIKVSPLGKAVAEVSFAGTDEAVSEVSGGMGYDELMNEIVPQIEQMMKDTSKESVERISETVGDAQLSGLKFKATYGSVSDMLSNDLFNAFNQSVAVPVTSAETAGSANGVQLRSVPHWYGTEYYVNGNLSITQGQPLTEEEEAQMTGANINMAFKFPFTSFSNPVSKNIFAPRFTFKADEATPDVPIHFYVFTPNIPMLIAALLIILLLIRLSMLSNKVRKLTDKITAAGTAAMNAAENAGEAFKDFAADAIDKAEDIAEDVKDAAGDFVNDAKEKVQDAKEAVEDFIAPDDASDDETDNTDSGDNE